MSSFEISFHDEDFVYDGEDLLVGTNWAWTAEDDDPASWVHENLPTRKEGPWQIPQPVKGYRINLALSAVSRVFVTWLV